MSGTSAGWVLVLIACLNFPLAADTVNTGGPPAHGSGICDPFSYPAIFSLDTYQPSADIITRSHAFYTSALPVVSGEVPEPNTAWLTLLSAVLMAASWQRGPRRR